MAVEISFEKLNAALILDQSDIFSEARSIPKVPVFWKVLVVDREINSSFFFSPRNSIQFLVPAVETHLSVNVRKSPLYAGCETGVLNAYRWLVAVFNLSRHQLLDLAAPLYLSGKEAHVKSVWKGLEPTRANHAAPCALTDSA